MSICRPGKWILFLVWGSIATCLVLGVTADGFAQPVSVGIKAGVPFTGLLQSPGTTFLSGIAGGSSSAQTPHYAIGPVVDIRLPGQYDLELGVMYKSVQQQAPDITLLQIIPLSDGDSQAIFQTHSVSKMGRSWEFPVAVRYHFSSRSLRPYVEGGYSYNHLSGIFLNSIVVANQQLQLPLPEHISAPTPSTINRSGFLVGAGVEIKLPLIRLTPGIRYARYDRVGSPQVYSPNVVPTLAESPNALDFMVSFNLNSIFSSPASKARP